MENYRIPNTPVRSKMRDSSPIAPPGSATTAVKSQRVSHLTENASKGVLAADLQETSPERKPEIKNDFQPFMDTEALNRYVRKGGIRQYGATILTTASDSEEFDPEENSRRVLREILRQREERRQRAQTHVSPSPSVKTEHHRASVPYDIHRDTSETGEREVHLSPTPVVNEAPRHANPADRDEDYVEDDMDVESDRARPLRGVGLSVAAINTRLDAVGRAAYDIQDIGPADLRATVTRALMGHLYGGGQQTMFPNPSSHKLKNGFDNLGFINRKLNPYAPTRPGHTGLFFVMNPLWTGHMTKRLFVQLGQSQWLYLGLYQFIPVQPLSVDEFQQLEPATRSGWVNHMFSKQWGRQFLIRIALRDENGGIEPPAHQVAAIFADRVASKSYADRHRVTEQQVMNAFLSGKERLCVSGLKCIDYDPQWKKYLIEQGRDFVPKKKNIPREDIELDEDRFLGQDRQPKPRRRERPRRAVDLDLAQPISNDARRVSAAPTVIRQRLKEAGLGSDSSDLSEIESGGEEKPTASDGGVSEMEVEAMIWELL